METTKPLLGEILLQRKILTRDQLQKALDRQTQAGGILGEILIELGFLEERDIVVALVVQCNIPYISLDKYEIDRNIVKMISKEAAQKHLAIPIDRVGNVLSMAMANPLDMQIKEELAQMTNCQITPLISTKVEIANAIERLFK